ncbi:MAG TPA: FAD-dependent oxidoreductase, partial [Ktedonobacterales bacterium]|nr:FAD-dependent oxidoreductase [Ktedonobacterales bacterium]
MNQTTRYEYDAVVVGAGPNGLAAAITLARAGRSVAVYEAEPTVGGGTRTKELTLPGFRHDVCSAIHPLGLGSPFFQSLALDIDWIHPPLPLAHPLPDGTAALLYRSLSSTAQGLGADGPAWRRLMGSLVAGWEEMAPGLLG